MSTLKWTRALVSGYYADGAEHRYYVDRVVDHPTQWSLTVYRMETVAGVRYAPHRNRMLIDEGYARKRDACEVAQCYESVEPGASRLRRATSAWMDGFMKEVAQ